MYLTETSKKNARIEKNQWTFFSASIEYQFSLIASCNKIYLDSENAVITFKANQNIEEHIYELITADHALLEN